MVGYLDGDGLVWATPGLPTDASATAATASTFARRPLRERAPLITRPLRGTNRSRAFSSPSTESRRLGRGGGAGSHARMYSGAASGALASAPRGIGGSCRSQARFGATAWRAGRNCGATCRGSHRTAAQGEQALGHLGEGVASPFVHTPAASARWGTGAITGSKPAATTTWSTVSSVPFTATRPDPASRAARRSSSIFSGEPVRAGSVVVGGHHEVAAAEHRLMVEHSGHGLAPRCTPSKSDPPPARSRTTIPAGGQVSGAVLAGRPSPITITS